MGDHQTAQAVQFIRALRHELHEMTTKLAWVERQEVTARNGRACAMRMEASALRRDIKQAQALVDQLQRRYLNGDEQMQQRPPIRQPQAMPGPCGGEVRRASRPAALSSR